MKKGLLHRSLAAASMALVLLSACTGINTGFENPDLSKADITFDLAVSSAVTRSEIAGDDDYNENRFSSVEIFLYDEDTFSDDTQAVMHEKATLTTSTAGGVKTVTASISLGQIKDQLSAARKRYKVYAIANYPETFEDDKTSLNDLKALQVKSADFRSDVAPSDFVMTTFNDPITVSVKEDDETVKPSDKLIFRRVAAKIRVAMDVIDHIEDGKDTWFPDINNMHLYISNGVKTARLDGNVSKDGELLLNLKEEDYFHILTQGSTDNDDYKLSRLLKGHDSNALPENKNTTGISYRYYNELPYYTYPNEWRDGVTESHQTMLTIVVPWKDKETNFTTYRPTYYRIPVNNDGNILSNAYYYLRLYIGMMGSEAPELPMELDAECEMADWGQADDIEADLRPIRYLIFNQTEYVMNNKSSISIPFVSTHNCKLMSCKVTYYNYTNNNGPSAQSITQSDTSDEKQTTMTSPNNALASFTCKIDNTDNNLIFTHDFFSHTSENNKKYDYTKYDVVITLQHNTNSSLDAAYNESVEITVYPAIYIDTEPIQRTGYPGSKLGWTFINGYDGGTSLGSWPDDNAGRVMTTLTITQLEPEDAVNWTIGDPRTYYINNELDDESMKSDNQDVVTAIWSANNGPYNGVNHKGTDRYKNECRVIWQYYENESPDWTIDWSPGREWNVKTDRWTEENKRTISYYYPVSEIEDKNSFIGPKITVTSGHGLSGLLSRQNARRRCASYQQYGYPAGRWRIPTEAEARFIYKLEDTRHALPNIFVDKDVWVNGGHYNLSSNRYLSGNAVVRCVYDTWYWEQVDAEGHEGLNRIPDPDGTKANWHYFTWGDRPKENPQTKSGGGKTVDTFLQKHAKGNYAVIREDGEVRYEKMQ